MNPEPSAAALLAVKAVEDVSIHAVIPHDTNATLGKVINALEASGRWTFKPARDSNMDAVIALARFAWSSPRDRHAGTATYSQTTVEQAEAIIQAAIVLVRWFAEGQVVRATPDH